MDTVTAEIGMGATVCYGSDREPATVIAISKSGKTATLRFDVAVRTDTNGMSDMQEYDYIQNPHGATVKAYCGKRGWKISGFTPVVMGRRRKYYDYCF